jgi:glycosyltransferase involved in cell wall biosynthesis
MSSDITVVIATIPIRAKMLRKALASVVLQTFQPAAIVVEYDHEHTGAAATKNRGLARVTSDWVAFLDDDDQFMPEHLEKLREAQLATGADVVYSMPFIPQIPGGIDPSGMRGAPFDWRLPASPAHRERLRRLGRVSCPARRWRDVPPLARADLHLGAPRAEHVGPRGPLVTCTYRLIVGLSAFFLRVKRRCRPGVRPVQPRRAQLPLVVRAGLR